MVKVTVTCQFIDLVWAITLHVRIVVIMHEHHVYIPLPCENLQWPLLLSKPSVLWPSGVWWYSSLTWQALVFVATALKFKLYIILQVDFNCDLCWPWPTFCFYGMKFGPNVLFSMQISTWSNSFFQSFSIETWLKHNFPCKIFKFQLMKLPIYWT